jgi:hypothetical protein
MARNVHQRLLGLLLSASVLATMIAAPSASAAGDPVAAGRFDLALSPTFKQQLHKRHSSIAVSGLAIQGGSIDPLTGTGSLKLSGRVSFSHRGKSVSFQKLTAILGPNGTLSGNATRRHGRVASASTTLFDLSGGSIVRDGFGAQISGVQARFGSRGAGSLRQFFGVRLPSGSAGSLALNTQPATVEVLGGMATVTQDLSVGGVAGKLRAHCIDPVSGIKPSGQATQPGGPGNPFQIPVSGGTISPNGWTDGEVDLAGGMDIEVGGPGLPGGCPTSSVATVHLADFAVNVARKSVLTDFSVGGPYSPFGSNVIRVELVGDTSHATMLADPAAHLLTASGASLGLDATSVMVMNQYLPHVSGGSSTNFAVGDLLGSASMTVNTR